MEENNVVAPEAVEEGATVEETETADEAAVEVEEGA